MTPIGSAAIGPRSTVRSATTTASSCLRPRTSRRRRAIVSDADLDTEGAEWAVNSFLRTVRMLESDRAVFVGIAPTADAAATSTASSTTSSPDLDRDPRYTRRRSRLRAHRRADVLGGLGDRDRRADARLGGRRTAVAGRRDERRRGPRRVLEPLDRRQVPTPCSGSASDCSWRAGCSRRRRRSRSRPARAVPAEEAAATAVPRSAVSHVESPVAASGVAAIPHDRTLLQ